MVHPTYYNETGIIMGFATDKPMLVQSADVSQSF